MIVSANDRILADHVRIANTFMTRLKGLMGKKSLDNGEGLLLLNCPSIHCFFMKMTIDAVYLSKDMTVLDTETLAPWKIGKYVKNTAHVLELAAGAARVSKGEIITLHDGQA